MSKVRLNNLRASLEERKSKYQKRLAEKELYEERLSYLKESIRTEREEIDRLEKVVYLLKRTAEYAREQERKQIEKLVSFCLHFIFEEDISFLIKFKDTKRNAADFFVTTKFNELVVETDPTSSRGGGVVDIVSLAIRLAFLQTAKPLSEGPLILDEPAKHVSVEYISRVSDFVSQISKRMGRQIIMITHSVNLSAIGDKSFYVHREKSESVVKEMC